MTHMNTLGSLPDIHRQANNLVKTLDPNGEHRLNARKGITDRSDSALGIGLIFHKSSFELSMEMKDNDSELPKVGCRNELSPLGWFTVLEPIVPDDLEMSGSFSDLIAIWQRLAEPEMLKAKREQHGEHRLGEAITAPFQSSEVLCKRAKYSSEISTDLLRKDHRALGASGTTARLGSRDFTVSPLGAAREVDSKECILAAP